jgi:hypothetical protein
MPKERLSEEETSEEDDTLLNDLEGLETDNQDPPTEGDEPAAEDDPAPAAEETPENIVDAFAKGDMDAVKQQIQDKVIAAVSTIVNSPVEDDSAPAAEKDEETAD